MIIKYSKKENRNLDNYENVTVEISAEDEVDFNNETKEECFLRLKDFVVSRLPHQFMNNDINIEEVKQKISKLIALNAEKYRKIIKDILSTYNVTKTQDLSKQQLKEFNEKLEDLNG